MNVLDDITIVSTEVAESRDLHFEWYGGRIVNVVAESDDRVVDSFSFKQEPTYQQVVAACRSYFF